MKRLDDAERHAAAAEETAARTTHDAARASALVQGRAAKQAAAAAEADGSRGELTMALARLRDVGRESGIDTEPVVAPLNLPDGPCGQPEIEAARRSMACCADSRDEAVKRVLELAETAMAREEDVRSARASFRNSRQPATRPPTSSRPRGPAGEIAASHVARWRELARSAAALGLAGLAVPDPDDIGLADWAETLDGPIRPRERCGTRRRARSWRWHGPGRGGGS